MKRLGLILSTIAVGLPPAACLDITRPDADTAGSVDADVPLDSGDAETSGEVDGRVDAEDADDDAGDDGSVDIDGGQELPDGGCTGTPCTEVDAVACGDPMTAAVCTEVAPGCRVWVPRSCDDSRDCTTDFCIPDFGCANELVPDTCLIDEVCRPAGYNLAGGCLTCQPDRNPLGWSTSDAECAPLGGCKRNVCQSNGSCLGVNEPNGTVCDDEDACTGGDTCVDGSCTGTPVVCLGDQCNDPNCNPASGCELTPKPAGSPCDDGNSCTSGESCLSGACVSPPECECFNPKTCAAGSCLGAWDVDQCGCEADDSLCSALNGPCSTGQCAGEVCNVTLAPLGEDCDDGNPCTGEGACNAVGVCDAGDPTVCDDGLSCTVDACDGTGGCTFALMPDFCLIGGQCVAVGTTNPANPCESCSSDPADWTPIDGGPCDDGNNCTVEDACFDGTCNGVDACGELNTVFVTSFQTKGAFTVAEATEACQSNAMAGGLSDPTSFFPLYLAPGYNLEALIGEARGFKRTDGRVVGDTVQEIYTGQLFYPPVRDESGQPNHGLVWWGDGNNCDGWENDGPTEQGRAGRSGGGNLLWSNHVDVDCDENLSLYCVQAIHTTAVVRPLPTDGATRTAFITFGTWAPNAAGIGGADALCQAEASGEGLVGSYKAMLATDGLSAASRFDASGPPWHRPDGAQLWGTADGIAESSNGLLAPITLFANGDYALPFVRVWTGAESPTDEGSLASTCNNWAGGPASGADTGDNTQVGHTTAGWFNTFQQQVDCETPLRLFCLQE